MKRHSKAIATEIVHAWIPALAQAVVVAFAVGVACMWVTIYATRVPA